MKLAPKLLLIIVMSLLVPMLALVVFFYMQSQATNLEKESLLLKEKSHHFEHSVILDRYELLVNTDLISDINTVKAFKEEIFAEFRIHESMFAIFENGRMVSSTGDDQELANAFKEVSALDLGKGIFKTDDGLFVSLPIEAWGWLVLIGKPMAEINQGLYQAVWKSSLILFGSVFAMGAFLMLFIKTTFLKPISLLMDFTDRIASHEFDYNYAPWRSRDELGVLSKKMRDMAKSIHAHKEEKERWGQDLERKIDLRTAELQKANLSLEESLQGNQRFIAQMSHDLRTPLNAIIGYSELILEAEDDSEWSKEDIKHILSSGNFLLHLIEDVLAYNKIESHKFSVAVKEIEPQSYFKSFGPAFAHSMNKNGNQMVINVEEGLPLFYTDPLRISQVINNLLSNAGKFTHDGVITLTVSRQQDSLEISVEDTGIGIKEEYLAKVFDVYEQVHDRNVHDVHGTGIGLSICLKIAQSLNGSITVSSSYGQGSKFTVTLRDAFNEEHLAA